MTRMLQLNAEQAAALQSIKRERDMAALSDTLAASFPEVQARLGERYAALIELGVTRAAAHALDHAACVARFIACWFVLGAEFETKPGFDWARELLGQRARPQGGRVFQLCRRTRELLTHEPNPAMTSAAFDLALVALDQGLTKRGTVGSLLPTTPLQLGEPCDIDALDLRLLESAKGSAPQTYQLQEQKWRRLPAASARAPVTLAAAPAGQAAPTLPARLHILGQPPGGEPTRLRLRTRAARCCDSQLHPLVTLNGPQGLQQWRGPLSSDVTLGVYSDPAAYAPPLSIAVDSSPQFSMLAVGSCGMRDLGQPLGEQQTQLAAYSAQQHLMAWRRDPLPPMTWPESTAPTPAESTAQLRIESDGQRLDASRWQAGLQDLDRQLGEGLARLATAWERESGVQQGQLSAEPSVMSGTASVTWGWAESPQGMNVAPYYRVAGLLDLVACQLKLHLQGALDLHGSSSRLALACTGRELLQLNFERQPTDADLSSSVQLAQVRVRHPFVLQLESMASERGVMLDVAGPVAGAMVGSCGLRARAAGAGLEWFCSLALEKVSCAFVLHDPVLGQRKLLRPLLPAMNLVDWSLG